MGVPGSRGSSSAPGSRLLQSFRGAARPAVSPTAFLFSGTGSGQQPLLEAPISGAHTHTIHIRVPGPHGASGLSMQSLLLAARGVPWLSFNGETQDGFSGKQLGPAVLSAVAPDHTLLLGRPATREPPAGAVLKGLWSFVCHAYCDL